MSNFDLNDEQVERYARHIILKDVGLEGQQKISQSKVLIVGAGGLGSPAAMYLAAAGVGEIGIADGDVVELSNLQRQVIHTTQDIGKQKVLSAKETIQALNPNVRVTMYHEYLDASNMLEIVRKYDFVIDGADNFACKFLINDACVLANIPFSHGGILRFSGQTMTIKPNESACYACVFDSPPPKDQVPTCSSAGILGSIAGILGTIQATEALKYITGYGELLTNKLMIFDATVMDFDKLNVKRNPTCRVCGEHGIKKLSDYEQVTCDMRE